MTRRFSIVIVALVAMGTVSCSASHFIKYASKPEAPAATGEFKVAALHAPVTVTLDAHKVPHIVAQNEDDMWFAVGWTQARERLFQMDVLRRMAGGRMSELLGAQDAPAGMPFKDLLGMDRFFRVMGLAQLAERQIAQASPESRKLIESYVAGVNAYIASGEKLPIEYALLNETPQPWVATDVMTVSAVTTFELSTNFMWELMRYMLAAELGPDAQKEIYPSEPQWGPHIIEKGDHDFTSMPRLSPDPMKNSPMVDMQKEGVPLSQWMPAATAILARASDVQDQTRPYMNPSASNNWVISGAHTASGKPMLANDPHLLHGAPATFYLMHIQCPGVDAIGGSLPGTPFLTMGRNKHMGWGVTNTFADVQDIYLERLDPNDSTKYMTENGSEPFRIEKHVIRERVGRGKYVEHPFELRYTRHGAVLNDSLIEGLPAGSQPIALKTAAVWPSDETMAVNKWIRSTSVKDFQAALQGYWGLPVQNWVAIDDQGHIGYFPIGLIPLRKTFDGTVPVPGWTGQYEWEGRIPTDQLPQLYDPPSGIIVTANNQVVPAEDYPYPYSIDTMPGYRAARIRELLTAKNGWTFDEIREMQTDAYAKQGERLSPILLKALEGEKLNAQEQKAYDALKSWDFVAGVDSIGASVFFTTYRSAWKLALEDDLPLLFKRLVKIFSVTYGFFDSLWADNAKAKVWDLKNTPQVEDRDALLRAAFHEAVKHLDRELGKDVATWRWGRMHQITFHHPFGAQIPGHKFDIGPFEHPGAWDTVWAAGGGFWGDDRVFPVTEGPAFRQVLDLGNEDDTNMIVDLGQSGWPMTDGYSNAVGDWIQGKLWKLSQKPDVYSQGATGSFTLVPNN